MNQLDPVARLIQKMRSDIAAADLDLDWNALDQILRKDEADPDGLLLLLERAQ